MRSAPGWPLRSAPATLDVVQTGADTCTFTLERQKFRKEDNDFRADLSAALAAVPETEKERRPPHPRRPAAAGDADSPAYQGLAARSRDRAQLQRMG